METFSFAKVLITFGSGVVSILSPCVLPLIPSYICYITGLSFDDFANIEDARRVRRLTIFHSLFFILGFTIIFVLLGAAATAIGQKLFASQDIIMKIGGALIFIFGLLITGWIKIPFLQGEKKFHLTEKPAGYIGTILVGMVFGAGWTPCVGPFLGAALSLAATSQNVLQGMILLAAYSLGLSLPFFIASLALNSFLSYSKKIRRFIPVITSASGVLLMVIGILLVTGYFTVVSAKLQSLLIFRK